MITIQKHQDVYLNIIEMKQLRIIMITLMTAMIMMLLIHLRLRQ